MSSKPPLPSPSLTDKEFKDSLEQPAKLSELVRRLMELSERDARRLIGDTTKTGFRRVHEHITSAIDRALEILARARGGLDDESLNRILVMFTRGLILLNYQEARDQLDRELAVRVKAMVDHATEVLKTRSVDRIRNTLEFMRTLMDAMLVLVYRYAR